MFMDALHIAGTFGRGKVWWIYFLQAFGKTIWQINRLAKKLLITHSNLDYSLTHHGWFASTFPCQTYPLYGSQ